MIKKYLSWINSSILVLISIILLSALAIHWARPNEVEISDNVFVKRPLPKPAFAQPQSAYEDIAKTGCRLKFSPATLQLPDLRNHLIYYGKNGRPDAQADRLVLHFGFGNQSSPFTITAGERVYLKYDRQLNPSQYVCCKNQESPLWMEASTQGNEAVVTIRMKDENGDIIQEPATHAQFTLSEKEGGKTSGRVWEIGKWRVDGSLLARQKARWMGKDRFLERHGGDEYKELADKHRIDFADDTEHYSVFVSLNDVFVWDSDQWKVVKPGPESRGHPLMIVKKVDERVMNCELWDVGGKQKIPLTLIRVNEPSTHHNLADKFKFLGARTRTQYIFEIEGQRILLSPKDWLLQTEEGWVKLSTAQQIDDYVNRKTIGILFVFDGVDRQGDKQILKGVVFNASRTDIKELEIPVQQSGANRNTVEERDDEEEDDDDLSVGFDDEDEEDDDDDDD